jgi:hypothetical protein
MADKVSDSTPRYEIERIRMNEVFSIFRERIPFTKTTLPGSRARLTSDQIQRRLEATKAYRDPKMSFPKIEEMITGRRFQIYRPHFEQDLGDYWIWGRLTEGRPTAEGTPTYQLRGRIGSSENEDPVF